MTLTSNSGHQTSRLRFRMQPAHFWELSGGSPSCLWGQVLFSEPYIMMICLKDPICNSSKRKIMHWDTWVIEKIWKPWEEQPFVVGDGAQVACCSETSFGERLVIQLLFWVPTLRKFKLWQTTLNRIVCIIGHTVNGYWIGWFMMVHYLIYKLHWYMWRSLNLYDTHYSFCGWGFQAHNRGLRETPEVESSIFPYFYRWRLYVGSQRRGVQMTAVQLWFA